MYAWVVGGWSGIMFIVAIVFIVTIYGGYGRCGDCGSDGNEMPVEMRVGWLDVVSVVEEERG
jgi:hypothetical protein